MSARKGNVCRNQRVTKKRQEAVFLQGGEILFITHGADRESPAQRLYYKVDLQGCACTVRYLETKIAVAL